MQKWENLVELYNRERAIQIFKLSDWFLNLFYFLLIRIEYSHWTNGLLVRFCTGLANIPWSFRNRIHDSSFNSIFQSTTNCASQWHMKTPPGLTGVSKEQRWDLFASRGYFHRLLRLVIDEIFRLLVLRLRHLGCWLQIRRVYDHLGVRNMCPTGRGIALSLAAILLYCQCRTKYRVILEPLTVTKPSLPSDKQRTSLTDHEALAKVHLRPYRNFSF